MSVVVCDWHREGSASHFGYCDWEGHLKKRNPANFPARFSGTCILHASCCVCDSGSFLFIFKENSTVQPDTTKYSCVTSFISNPREARLI